MKTIHKGVCTVILLGLAPAAQASGAGKPEPMWQKFYAVLATVVRGGNKDAKQMVCLEVPGLLLTPLNSREPADVSYVNQLLDQTAAYNPVHTRGKSTFSKVYDEIMQFHVADRAVPLTPHQLADFDRAVELTKPTGASMKQYEKCQDEYDAATMAQEAERLANKASGKDAKVQAATSTRVTRAWNAWMLQGKKKEVEAALGTAMKYMNGDPASWWYARNNDFQKAAFQDGYIVSTFPPVDQWASDNGWMTFSFRASSTQPTDLNTMDVKAAALLKLGGGQAAGQMQALAADHSLEITMKIKKVIILRPWADWQVFASDRWTWDRGVISDGKGEGRLPLYTTAFIIARDVTFKANSITPAFKQAYEKELKAPGQPSFGPFSLRPKGGRKPGAAQEAQNEITIRDPQIVAYVCTIVPKCPAKTVK